MDYQETIKSKRGEAAEKQEKQASLDAFEGLATSIKTLLDSLETTGVKKLDKEYIQSVKRLETIYKGISAIKVTSDQDIKKALRSLTIAFNNLDIRPVVNVPQPKVVVQEREIDLKPLINEINKGGKPGKTLLTLSDYKAQDINDLDPSIQYVGFVNPMGGWYIIENNLLENSLRYKFGRKNYKKAWEKPQEHQYKLLNEALNEVQA